MIPRLSPIALLAYVVTLGSFLALLSALVQFPAMDRNLIGALVVLAILDVGFWLLMLQHHAHTKGSSFNRAILVGLGPPGALLYFWFDVFPRRPATRRGG